MSLSAGARFGPYVIVGKLGAGGMGEVWRATDTRLGRDVALKVLPPGLGDDPERHARFEREAKMLAALNHSNIATLHALEHLDGQHVLVMELVEGEDLAARIARGPVPVDEAIPIARQIVEALEAAHEQGIVHRDLKPANVKVRPDGTVKVLDFGLAKSVEAVASSDPALSPTLTHPATRAGLILGTAAYMAPEQAKGQPVDKRADIWAFGVVVVEMLTGSRLFAGESVAETLASVLRREIDLAALPAATPPGLRRLLGRCLDRDPRLRLRDIGEARVALSASEVSSVAPTAPAAGPLPASAPAWRRLAAAGAVAILAGAITGVVVWRVRAPAPPRVVRFAITLGTFQVPVRAAPNIVAISPDGEGIVYVADQQLNLRQLSEVEGRPVRGSADDQLLTWPVFSPDGEDLAYYSWSRQAILRIPVGGGTPATVCACEPPEGISWSGGSLLFGQPAGVMRVAAAGGVPELLVPASGGERVYGPQLLPGGRSLLFSVTADGLWDRTGQVVVQSLASAKRTVLVDGGAADGRYVPTGHLLFAREGVAYALAFDAAALATRGAPVRVIEGVRRSQDARGMYVAVSRMGTLAYLPGSITGDALRLALFDSAGGMTPLAIPTGSYSEPRVSPDGARVAMVKVESGETAIWVGDTSGAAAPRRLTFEGANRFPVWSHDGARVTFQSERGDDRSIYWQPADGSGEAQRLMRAAPGVEQIPQSWSPDGRYLLFDEVKAGLFSLSLLSVRDKASRTLVGEPSRTPSGAVFSPDGRWLAYSSKAAGQRTSRVYVLPFPPTGARYLVSDPGEDGHHPAWSRDGRDLFYTPGPGNRLQRVAITTTPALRFSPAVTLRRRFTNAPPTQPRTYDVAPDGRFLGLIELSLATDNGMPLTQIYVVLNWFEELMAKVPTR